METISRKEFEVELQKTFNDYNKEYFGGKLTNPAILLETPKTKGYAGYDCHDKKMRIEPEVITGDDAAINEKAPIKGRKQLIVDALLHEMIHKYCCEFLKVDEREDKGHGPIFKDQCNRIAEILELAICNGYEEYERFPLNVRHKDVYMGASLEFSDEMNKLARVKQTCGSMIARLVKGTEKGDDDIS